MAVFVATTGIASTARAQVGESFDALKATEVRVIAADPTEEDPFPVDADSRLSELNGVVVGGTFSTIDSPSLDVRASPEPSPNPTPIPVIAATSGAIRAARPTLALGVLFNEFHQARGERVAVVGSAVAEQLGISRIDTQPALFIGDTGYTVIGVLSNVARNREFLLAVLIPARSVRQEWLSSARDHTALIDVEAGAAGVVGSQVAVALRPDASAVLQVIVPPDPRTLRRQIEGDVTGLLYALAGLALVVGMIGIANTTLVSVLERRGEIGVRRALGARRIHITSQFLTESAALGAVGGIVGTSLGIVSVVVVATVLRWTTTIEPQLLVPAPFIGLVAGLLAGFQPALRASRISPAAALRSE